MSFGEEYGGELTRPANVAIDSEGDVYVAGLRETDGCRSMNRTAIS